MSVKADASECELCSVRAPEDSESVWEKHGVLVIAASTVPVRRRVCRRVLDQERTIRPRNLSCSHPVVWPRDNRGHFQVGYAEEVGCQLPHDGGGFRGLRQAVLNK